VFACRQLNAKMIAKTTVIVYQTPMDSAKADHGPPNGDLFAKTNAGCP
jgi:hypothetical protein